MDIERLHFLIHPGFRSDCSWTNRSEEERCAHADSERQRGPQIQKYVHAAQGMSRAEIMFLFSHATRNEFLQDAHNNKLHTRGVAKLHSILGDRLQLIFADYDIFTPHDSRAFRYAERQARSKGYNVTANVPSVAYGEKLGYCVEQAADALNIAGGLTQKTVIEPRRCDLEIALRIEPEYIQQFMLHNGHRTNITHRQIDPVTMRRLSRLED